MYNQVSIDNEKRSQDFTCVDGWTILHVKAVYEEARLTISLKLYDNEMAKVHQDRLLQNPSFFGEPYGRHSYLFGQEGLRLAVYFRFSGVTLQ